MSRFPKRVVVTGIGAVAPNGLGVADYSAATNNLSAQGFNHALQFGRGIDAAVADRFVAMYVNELTQDYGDEGRKAVTELLRRGEALGAFPAPVQIDFVS